MLKKRITILGRSMPFLVPVAISLVVVAIALAATLLTVTQQVTQEIYVTEPTNYGSIVAPSISLPDVAAGSGGTFGVTDGVVVVLAAAGADMYLHLDITEADVALYTAYTVTLTCTAIPGAATNIDVSDTIVVTKGGVISASNQLDGAGTYTFTEDIAYTAGPTAGNPDVSVTISLTDAS